MLDAPLRRRLDPALDALGRRLARAGLDANAVTLAGFAIGILSFPALAAEQYGVALALILLNRAADGLDGAIARARGPSDLGAYLDIVLDFIFYAGVPVAFAIARPEHALMAAFLVFTFVGTMASFLGFAIIAAKRNLSTAARGRKTIYYLGGLAEGTETILFMVAICLFPDAFAWIGGVFALLCWVTTGSRIAQAVAAFRK